ncbi:MAG: hypothetical protein M3406_14460 [Chloroflexota bacterium]|nr:hypothetical protein [Chloroflexota bacterium]
MPATGAWVGSGDSVGSGDGVEEGDALGTGDALDVGSTDEDGRGDRVAIAPGMEAAPPADGGADVVTAGVEHAPRTISTTSRIGARVA